VTHAARCATHPASSPTGPSLPSVRTSFAPASLLATLFAPPLCPHQVAPTPSARARQQQRGGRGSTVTMLSSSSSSPLPIRHHFHVFAPPPHPFHHIRSGHNNNNNVEDVVVAYPPCCCCHCHCRPFTYRRSSCRRLAIHHPLVRPTPTSSVHDTTTTTTTTCKT
jgi:hypothetical protein